MRQKINTITRLQAAIILILVGAIVFSSGLTNHFLGDDSGQIVVNPVVHSLGNIRLFFEGSTFYGGQGSTPLVGFYYRPLMTTVFSAVYTLFGLHPMYFHIVQFGFCIASAYLLYLFFRYSFKPGLALLLALFFLVHPVNSQNVFAIANMQDALYFFFGMLGLWLLARFRSSRSLLAVVFCFFLALLAKETGILFMAVAALYLFLWDRKRLSPFLGIAVLPVLLWLVLKHQATGLFGYAMAAPIDRVGLAGRLLNVPAIIGFYIGKLIWPVHLAHAYYWTHPYYSFRYFLVPLLIELVLVVLGVYVGVVLKRRATKKQYQAYLFFAAWTIIGLLPALQVIPLDMTVSESWLYFSVAGVLGLLGVCITNFSAKLKANSYILVSFALVLLVLLGARTAVRGRDWHDDDTLIRHDLSLAPDNYNARNMIALDLINEGDIEGAKDQAAESVRLFPRGTNYDILGYTYSRLGNYAAAQQSYFNGLRYTETPQVNRQLYENIGVLMLEYGDNDQNIQFVHGTALVKYPKDASLWIDLAVLEYRAGDTGAAKAASDKAYALDPSPQLPSIYKANTTDKSFGSQK